MTPCSEAYASISSKDSCPCGLLDQRAAAIFAPHRLALREALLSRRDSQAVGQSGYGAFSIGFSQVESVREYILEQAEHHRRLSFLSFQDEFMRFLERYQIAYDERYVWD